MDIGVELKTPFLPTFSLKDVKPKPSAGVSGRLRIEMGVEFKRHPGLVGKFLGSSGISKACSEESMNDCDSSSALPPDTKGFFICGHGLISKDTTKSYIHPTNLIQLLRFIVSCHVFRNHVYNIIQLLLVC
jgi:hypothetical protein